MIVQLVIFVCCEVFIIVEDFVIEEGIFVSFGVCEVLFVFIFDEGVVFIFLVKEFCSGVFLIIFCFIDDGWIFFLVCFC